MSSECVVDDRRASLFLLFMGSGDRAVLQVPMLYRLAFDPFLLFDDGFRAAEVGVGWGCGVAALGIAPPVAMLDGSADLDIKAAGQEVVFKEDSVLQGLMPGLNLALGLWTSGSRGRSQ